MEEAKTKKGMGKDKSPTTDDLAQKEKISLPYFDEFLLHLASNNFSKKTIDGYERDLKVFEHFLTSTSTPFEGIDKRTVVQYKAYLFSRDRETALQREKVVGYLSSTTINRMISSLRSLLSYLIEMDLPCPLAPDAVRLVKTNKKHPQIAELDDLVRLIEAPTYLENDPRVALRNRAALEVLFSTGMRISELLSLNRVDIDDSGRIFIVGKGKKERFVYLTPRARFHIERYLGTRDDASPALFTPYRGRRARRRGGRISNNYLQERIKRYREKLKINIPLSAHSLRHGFATYLAESGANPAAIQILLGHESLDTTTRYVHASDRYAEETHRKFHPLRRPKEHKVNEGK